MSRRHQTAQLANGLRLEYVEQGARGGMPVVLLHGVTDSWRSFAPLLPDWLHVFALTQRGHGDGAAAATHNGADFADDIVAFMDACGLERVVLVGHSMGASNAMRCAQRHPQRVLALVLEGPFFDFRDNPVLAAFVRDEIAALADSRGRRTRLACGRPSWAHRRPAAVAAGIRCTGNSRRALPAMWSITSDARSRLTRTESTT